MMLRLLTVFALIFSAPAHAAFAGAEAVAAFAEAAKGHRRASESLAVARGMAKPVQAAATVDDVAGFIDGPRRKNDPYPPNSAVLMYHIADGTLSAWLIDAQGLRAASRAPLAEGALERAAENLRLSLGVDEIALSRAPKMRDAPPIDYPERETIEADAKAVALLLFPEPIRSKLKGIEHLVIVGNGVIATVPHAMLPLDGRAMLIDRMTISVSPGLFDLDRMVRAWDGSAMRAQPLVVGNPVVPRSAVWDVPTLPGAETEAKAVAARLSADALLGTAARKDIVVARLQTASLLYFAAHGVSNPLEPLTGGFLMLAGDTAEAGFLRAGELQRMRLTADLAVLSACQSGLGKIHDGGVIGLSRSFQKAGVPRVIMTLWNVSDESTSVLMQRFAAEAMRESPAVALRRAMLATRAEYPDPVHWAPFVLFGTPR